MTNSSKTIVNATEKVMVLTSAAIFAVWSVTLFLHAGFAAIIGVVHAVFFLGGLYIVGSATRTITWPALVTFFSLGITCGSIDTLLLQALSSIGINETNFLRSIFVAAFDEVLMLLPLLLFIWKRPSSLCLLGVTDILLIAAACATGFGFAERVFAIQNVPSLSWLPLMPFSGIQTTPRDGNWLINTHGVLGAIAGVSIGVSLLWRKFDRTIAFLIASVGVAYGFADHAIIGSLARDSSGFISNSLAFMIARGWITLYVFLLGVLAAVAFDSYIIYRKMPAKCKPLSNQGKSYSVDWWKTQLEMRSIAFSAFRYKCLSSPEARAALANPTLAVLSSLVKRYKRLHPESV